MNIITVNNLNLSYGRSHVLKDINLDIKRNKVTAIIGASGSGKSSLLRAFNRMNDLIDRVKIKGEITYNHIDIYKGFNVQGLRREIGIVFQKSEPFPGSIYENIEYAFRISGIVDKNVIDGLVRKTLDRVGLLEEVSYRLHEDASILSVGQQQRLCIARALALDPNVILLDEPTCNLDPISTLKIEELIETLREEHTVVIISHDMEQVKRVSDYVVVMNEGRIEEVGPTYEVFYNPKSQRTKEYITA